MNTILTILAIIVVLFILYKVFKMILSLVFIVLLVFIAYITNPTKEDHLKAIKRQAAMVSATIPDKIIKVENYKVLSISKAGKKNKLVGIGIFTQVWIFSGLKSLE